MIFIKKERKRNLRIFTFSNSLIALAFGLFGPFYLIFINNIGGSIENFGIAVGLVVLSGSLTSLIVGRYSDRFGRKPFLIFGGYASALIVLFYIIIGSLWQLYLLQIFSGMIAALFETSESAFLGDITEKEKRGSDIGKYDALVGISEAIAIFLGGFLVSEFGFEIVFFIVALIFVISTTVMFKLRENSFRKDLSRKSQHFL
ncbi:MFS transporter [Candidatus Woesearchaeota archaeon]|nr:MFS transporter [Candidatus Woesearchaeota archaeon]